MWINDIVRFGHLIKFRLISTVREWSYLRVWGSKCNNLSLTSQWAGKWVLWCLLRCLKIQSNNGIQLYNVIWLAVGIPVEGHAICFLATKHQCHQMCIFWNCLSILSYVGNAHMSASTSSMCTFGDIHVCSYWGHVTIPQLVQMMAWPPLRRQFII